jgi:citrate lyase subunit beta/citryl-CoA lyase
MSTTHPTTRSARTYLFVPADRPERFDKALATAADRVVIDLEDAVAPEHKDAARATLAGRLARATPDERERIVVRINDDQSAWFEADLAMLHDSAAAEVMLPKAERAETVARLRAACPHTAVLALVESARGVLAAEALACAPGVQRLVFGTVDFALDMDLSGDPVGFDFAAARLALASRAAGISAPVAGVTVAIDDEALLRAELARARAHGFGAKLCIHPRQVAMVHAALAPSDAELAWARRVIDAAAHAAGAAVQVDGRMVDKPVLLRAQALLARGQP